MPIPTKETYFASAKRTSPESIKETADELKAYDVVGKVLDAIPQFVALLDENRQIVAANANLVQALGGGRLELILGQRPGELVNCRHAKDAPGGCGTSEACRTCGAVNAILAAQEGQSTTRDCQITTDTDSEALDLQFTATPTPVGGRRLTTISIRDTADEQRRQVLERTFFHDVLNAAGGAWGIANVLNEAEDMDEVREFAPLLLQVTEQLIAEVQSQRDLIAAERGDLALQPDDISSRHLLEEIQHTYQRHPVADGRNIRLEAAVEEVVLRASRTLLLRVVGNMAKNALEETAPGGTVLLGCTTSDSGVCLYVKNEGVIPRPIQLQIFNRSFSTKGNGRGIGTYSMKLLGEKYLGGQVSFDSNEESGTTFRISLPNPTL